MEKAEESGVSPNPDHAQPAYAEPPWEGLQPQPQPASAQGFFSRSLGRASVAPPPTEAHPSTPTIRSRFVTLLSPKTQFRGWSRRRLFLLALLALCGILALALGLGLGLGLKKKSSSSSSLPLPSDTSTFTGDLTYYTPGLGACGIVSAATDLICAVSHIVFDAASTSADPNQNPVCGRTIRVQRYDTAAQANKSVDVTVVDRCVGCAADDLDLSPTAFERLADESLGRVTGTWAWLS